MKYLEKDKKVILKIKKEIESLAESQLRELIKWDSNRSFIELELEICKRLDEIGANILERLIPVIYGNGYVGPTVNINTNSKDDEDKFSYQCEKLSKTRSLKTIFGKINITRAVYSELYSGGQKSFLDEKLRIENKRHCPLTTYWTDLLGTIAPFEEAANTLNEIRGINVSTKQVQLSTEASAKLITESHEADIKDIHLTQKGTVPAVNINLNSNASKTVYIETDGCMIHTDNAWKECKTFMLFEIENISKDKHKLINKFYYSTMKDVNELKRQLKFHLERYCGKDPVRIVCVSDGAKWIWNMIAELFPKEQYPTGIIEIIDFFHAIEKIGDIKKEVFTNKDLAEKFYDRCKEDLKKGNIEVIKQTLEILMNKQEDTEKRKLIYEVLRYFNNNKERMKYAGFKEEKLCIGSGAIESANKFVIQRRVKLQGMIWKEENANYMVHLRAEYINKCLDQHYGIASNPFKEITAKT